MQKLFSIPLLFFLIAACIGLLLRWQFISPLGNITYTYVLHAHSHLMFLGWVFNVLFLAFVWQHIHPGKYGIFKTIFYLLQLLVTGMLVSFPLQGYGVYSIVLSTLHTFGAIIFIILFFRKTRNLKTASVWFARVSLIFFMVSSAGPFSLGYLMANGLGQTKWYFFSVYYYLHFQYNGFFVMGITSLFFGLLEARKISFDTSKAKTIGMWMALSCVPAYALSLLWADPGIAFNLVGLLAAIGQIIALFLFVILVGKCRTQLETEFKPISIFYFWVVFFAFALKLFLQLISAHPAVAALAYNVRPFVIAYLHLVLLGVISLFLFVWYIENNFVRLPSARLALQIFLSGFAGSQLCLVLLPWWDTFFQNSFAAQPELVFMFSILLVAGAGVFGFGYLRCLIDARNKVRDN